MYQLAVLRVGSWDVTPAVRRDKALCKYKGGGRAAPSLYVGHGDTGRLRYWPPIVSQQEKETHIFLSEGNAPVQAGQHASLRLLVSGV